MAFARKADVPPALFAQIAGLVALPITEASSQGHYIAAAKLLGEANVLETAARRAQKDGTDIDAERAKCATFMRLCREKGAGRDLLKPADVAAIQKKKDDETRKRGRAHVAALNTTAAAAPKATAGAGAIAAGAGTDDAEKSGSESEAAAAALAEAGAGADTEADDVADESDSDAAEYGPKAKKQLLDKKPLDDDALKKLAAARATAWTGSLSADKRPWIDRDTVVRGKTGSITREAHYLLTGEVTCLACNKAVSVVDTSNAGKHELRASHKSKWAEHSLRSSAAFAKALARSGSGDAVLTQLDISKRRERLSTVRALAASRIVVNGTNPNQMNVL